MARIFSWRDVSVSHKLYLLVTIPILLLLAFSARQIHSLTMQVENLTKAQHLVSYLDSTRDLYRSVQEENSAATYANDATFISSSLLFGDNTDAMIDIVNELRTTMDEAAELTEVYDQLDHKDWQADLYNQLLTAAETVSFDNANANVEQHISALMQLEWLMFWSIEENYLVDGLATILNEYGEFDRDIQSQILALGQNQQLYVERFTTLNANAEQVQLMIQVFSDDVFGQSQQFREVLLDPNRVGTLSQNEIALGLTALAGRLSLLQKVTGKIESELIVAVDEAISLASQERNAFIFILSVLTLSVILFAVRLAKRITSNLSIVLKYLNHPEESESANLSSQIKGNDEIRQFAVEVEKLTIEREHAQQRLTVAKEDAEQAKDAAVLASKAKSSFLANMSHEIRTPLNGVIGITEVLADTHLSATQKDYVDTIETSSHLLLSLINDILDFSKIESGMLLISPHSTSIRETIYDIASIVAPKAKQQQIELKVTISPETPYRINVDDHRLRQVLMNFMSNGVKFTSEGSVTLSAHCSPAVNGYVSMTFAVQDSGIGIDKEQQKKIFEPFSQEDDSVTRQFGGTGLGLAISTQLVELMEGNIQLDSTKGVGSRFYFTLKLPVDVEAYTPKKEDALQNALVLVSEDSSSDNPILNELDFYSLPVATCMPNMESITEAFNPDRPTTLLVVEDPNHSVEHTQAQLNRLYALGYPICLVRPFNCEPFDFGASIRSLVTMPLLGQRLIDAIRSAAKARMPRSSTQTAVNAKQKILIVEDNKINQKIAALHVEKAGFDYDIANDGKEGVDLYIKNHYYCLILMDCMMPVMDGFKATENIRQYEQETGATPIPIVALTASIIDDDIQHCFDVGMDDYVPKPFKATILREKLQNHARPTAPRFSDDTLVKEEESFQTTLEPPAMDSAVSNTGSESEPTIMPESTVTPEFDEPTPVVTKKEKILLVEDNRVNQKVASLLLSKAGYQFDIADNGQIAVDKFCSSDEYDIILMDCMMPVMDGFAATRKIRSIESDSGKRKTPIIALTASVIDDDIQRCYDSGMDAYVAKPVKKDKLIHQIESLTQ